MAPLLCSVNCEWLFRSIRRTSGAFIITGLALGSTVGQANDKQTPAAREIVSFVVQPFSQKTKEERVIFLKLLENYCQDFLVALPTNTPREDAWIDAESQTSDPNKTARLFASVEWSRRKLKEDFSTCVDKTRAVLQSLDRAERTDFTRRAEAAYLISLAITLNASDDFEIYAAQAGLRPKALGLDFLGSIRRALLITAMRTVEAER